MSKPTTPLSKLSKKRATNPRPDPALPKGFSQTLVSLNNYPQADLDLMRRSWKVVTSKTAKERETEAEKISRFINYLHAAFRRLPTNDEANDAVGTLLWEATLKGLEVAGEINIKLPESWLAPLLPVWQAWLQNDSAKKRSREKVGRLRDEAGKFTIPPENNGEFEKGNPHRFRKKMPPAK